MCIRDRSQGAKGVGIFSISNSEAYFSIKLVNRSAKPLHSSIISNEYKLRRLDSDTDIPYIYDVVSEAVSAPRTKVGIITHESTKLKGRYADFLKTRESQKFEPPVILSSDRLEITTDDERIVLYYIIRNSVRKVSNCLLYTSRCV